MKYRAALACITFLFLGSAVAAPPKPTASVWKQEPDSFLGLPLNGSLSELPDCQRGVIGFKQPVRCANRSSATYLQINPNPDIGLHYLYSLDAKLFEDKIQCLYMSGRTEDFEKLKDIFIQRYGKPHSDVLSEVKTKAGASFEDETLKWVGSKVTIVMSRYSDDINSYGASISVNQVQQKYEQAAAEKSRGGASQL